MMIRTAGGPGLVSPIDFSERKKPVPPWMWAAIGVSALVHIGAGVWLYNQRFELADIPALEDGPITTVDLTPYPKPPEPTVKPTRVITTPVRGGQQIYAQGGDLVVVSSVSPGAELLADGNIHVYGPMRGRALAGVKGDSKARIFCQQMSAELLSIAGHYKVSEDLRRDPLWGSGVQVSLSGDVLNIIRL